MARAASLCHATGRAGDLRPRPRCCRLLLGGTATETRQLAVDVTPERPRSPVFRISSGSRQRSAVAPGLALLLLQRYGRWSGIKCGGQRLKIFFSSIPLGAEELFRS